MAECGGSRRSVLSCFHKHLCFKVAHKLVFGNGYLTWEWDQGLRSVILYSTALSHLPLFPRSSLLPALYSLPFFLLKLLHLDYQWLVVLLPR